MLVFSLMSVWLTSFERVHRGPLRMWRPGSVSTAPCWQVSKPFYDTSLTLWRWHETDPGPLKAGLGLPWGRRSVSQKNIW